MNRLTMTLAVLCSASILLPVRAATIFSDDFSDTTASKINWIWYGNNVTMTFSGGSAVLKNTDAVYTGFLIHNFATKPSKFTLSAQITCSTPVNGAGLMFCLTTSPSVTGYTVQLGEAQNLFAYKYTASGSTPLISNKSSSFINAVTNTMMVSKSSDTFNIFANGKYVTRFNDTLNKSGDIAIIVPPKSQVTIDNVVMTDQFTQGSVSTCFSDSFLTTDLESDGWNITGSMRGQATVGAGKCVLNNTDTMYSSIVYTDGNFGAASMKAAVRQTAGTGMYGVCFVSLIAGDSGSVTYKSYAFLVDSMRQYSIVYPDSPSSWTRPAQSFIYGSLKTDTLEVIRYANHFAFKVNGYDVGEIIPAPASYRIDGAGLYVGTKTAATYDYFVVGGDSTGAQCAAVSSVLNRVVPRKTLAPLFGGSSSIYDIRGRKIGAWDKLTFDKLINGPYIIATKNAGGAEVKAVRVMKLPK
jgi:hypothetical protein